MSRNYRFNDQTQEIHVQDGQHYYYFSSYYLSDITTSMSDNEKINKAEELSHYREQLPES